jgi:hypothetical protein
MPTGFETKNQNKMIPKTVTIKHLDCNKDEIFIEVGKTYEVKSAIKKDGVTVGYEISTPRNIWCVSIEQIE